MTVVLAGIVAVFVVIISPDSYSSTSFLAAFVVVVVVVVVHGQTVEKIDQAREIAREEALKKLEEDRKKPMPERRPQEFGSDKDFQLQQALNHLKKLPVMVSKTMVERKEEAPAKK